MKEKAHCPHCGATMVEYRHGLNTGLTNALARCVEVFGRNPFFSTDPKLRLSHSQMCNFQKLRYWRLVERHNPDEVVDADIGKGWWHVTQRGIDFVLGRAGVKSHVVTYRAVPIREEGDTKMIHEIVDGYMFRGDYAAMSMPVSGEYERQLFEEQV